MIGVKKTNGLLNGSTTISLSAFFAPSSPATSAHPISLFTDMISDSINEIIFSSKCFKLGSALNPSIFSSFPPPSVSIPIAFLMSDDEFELRFGSSGAIVFLVGGIELLDCVLD